MQKKEFLEESKDFWLQSAEHDKFQAVSSFFLSGGGAILLGLGVDELFHGDIAGGLIVGVLGGAGVAAFGKDAVSEMDNYGDMRALAADRQARIDEIPNAHDLEAEA